MAVCAGHFPGISFGPGTLIGLYAIFTLPLPYSIGCATTGAIGLTRKITKMECENKSLLEIDDSKNNKIQSTIAGINTLAIAILFSLSGFASLGEALIAIAFFSLAGSVIVPHICKLFTSSEETRKKLDNFAGTAGAIINFVGGVFWAIRIAPSSIYFRH